MNQTLLKKIESEQFRKDNAQFGVGDSVKVHTKVVEGDKERIQIFSGVVIGKRGAGLNETFTVRRISYGEGAILDLMSMIGTAAGSPHSISYSVVCRCRPPTRMPTSQLVPPMSSVRTSPTPAISANVS